MKEFLFLKENRHVTWLELYFDLIFVVAIGKVTHLLGHTHNGELVNNAFINFIILFLPFWWIWVLHTSYSNRFDSDSRFHRILTLILMFMLIILSATLDPGGDNNYKMFLLVYTIAKIIILGFHLRIVLSSNNFDTNKQIVIALIIGTLISFLGVFFTYMTAVVLLFLSIAFEIFSIQKILNKSKSPADKSHLVERVGLLAIIMLGESVISLSASLTEVNWSYSNMLAGLVGFTIISMIWWIYFDSLELLIESEKDKKGSAIIYSQFFTYISFALIANTIKHAILQDLNIFEFRILAISGMIFLYIGKQTAFIFNMPKFRKYIVINTLIALTIALLSLAFSDEINILYGIGLSFIAYIIVNYKSQMKVYGKVNF